MTSKLDLKMNSLQQLCKQYKVNELYLFGSANTDNFTVKSDLDFMVKFDRVGFDGAFDQFIDFKRDLEKLYGRPVDLYHLKEFRNPIFQEEVKRSKKLLYAA